MRGHAERFGLPSPPKRIIATGGASANLNILNTVAAIFGSDVFKVQQSGIVLSSDYVLFHCDHRPLRINSSSTIQIDTHH